MSRATGTDTRSPALPAADSHDVIRVHGARVNNLKDVSIEIPKRRLTVFTGVSGSGKSSLVFGTIAAESQRLINETYSAFVQGFMPTLARPEADVLEGLTTAIIVDQQRMGADPRSTVGTATDANALLRILFSRLGKPHIGSPQAYSFNVASISGAGAVTLERGGKTVKERRSFRITGGMCPHCEGRGTVTDLDLSQLYDDSKSLREGALTVPGYTGGGWNSRLYTESGFYDPDKPIGTFTTKELHDFLHHEPVRMKIAGINQTYEGLIPRIQKSMLSKDPDGMQPHIREFVDRAVTFTTCPECDGTPIGLHPHDIQRMNDLLLRLRDKGNTVLVVEHKPETIAIADHAVDLGPGAGAAGGSVCFEGTVEELRASDTITGRHLDDRATLKETVREPAGTLEIRGAAAHNLRDVDVDIPLGVLVVVTGVAGSGKSSLVHGSIPAGADVVSVGQGAIRGSRRSNPATYTKLLDPIRTAFARANGVKPALFSPNSEGACPSCNGAGVIYTDLGLMAGVAITCEECEGKRFEASVLDYHLGGRDISEVLAMPVTEAREFFGGGEAHTPAAHAILGRLADAGLGYLTIGQPLTTLSGGERQRLKLATHMAEKGGTYVLDEPTAGLHLADVEQLLGLLDRLVDSGRSVIVVEHHQAVMAHADWIIDLGPGAGHDGGRIVFQGTPADLVAVRSTLTGEHLAAYVGA
jgi:excinuclease UvrABC ATPase subunit